jgi:hypothetical protein
LKKIAISPAENFGLENGNFHIETVPINVTKAKDIELVREI